MKKIEEIEAGDEVLSYNEQTKQTEYQTVLQTFSRFADDILSVKIEDEPEPLGVTSEHPFFVRVYGARSDTSGEGDREWREANQLKVGDEIRTEAGDWASVESIERREDARVYNFEVENNHNYFVGDLGLLAHNACSPKDIKALQTGGNGTTVVVKSKSAADELLKTAFPDYQKVRGIGPQDASPLRRSRKMERFKEGGAYHKDYSIDPLTGRVRGHDLNNSHGSYPHINIKRTDGIKVMITIVK